MALSDLFEISLDELVMGKENSSSQENPKLAEYIEKKICTPENKKVAQKSVRMIGIFVAIILAVDIISIIIYFAVYGVPK